MSINSEHKRCQTTVQRLSCAVNSMGWTFALFTLVGLLEVNLELGIVLTNIVQQPSPVPQRSRTKLLRKPFSQLCNSIQMVIQVVPLLLWVIFSRCVRHSSRRLLHNPPSPVLNTAHYKSKDNY